MFTKLVLNIGGEEITIHSHEVIKIASDLVKQTPLDDAFHPSPSITNLVIDKLLVPDNIFNIARGRYDHFLSVPNHIRKLSHLLHWFYAAKICQSANEKKEVFGKWFNISGRLVHIDFTEKDLYVSDHGLITRIIKDFKQIVVDFPWLSNPSLLEPLLMLKKIFDGYHFECSLPPEIMDERTIYLYEEEPHKNLAYQVKSLHGEHIREALDEALLGKKLIKSLKEKMSHKIPLTEDERNILIEKISAKGHILSLEALNKEREDRKKQYSQAVREEHYEDAKELDPSMTQESFEEIQRKHTEDDEYVELDYSRSELVLPYILDVICKKFAYLVYSPNPDVFLQGIFREVYFAVQDEEFQLLDSFIKRYVAKEIIKEVNMGKREFLFRPILSYGRKESGSAYHEFSRAITQYFTSERAISAQLLAGAMRAILAGTTNIPEELFFLPNLTAAWFISEVARNESSIISGMMLLDLIEQGKYSWTEALQHPQNDNMEIRVSDIYGNRKTPQQIGGIHPMAHTDSARHGDELGNGRTLNVARQKEGSLILEWLFEVISKVQPELIKEIVKVESSASIIPNYNLLPLEKIEEKEKDCRNKIRRQEQLPEDRRNLEIIKKENEKIANLSLEKKKWKIIEGLVKPLLELRFTTLANVLSLDLTQLIPIFEKFISLKIDIEEYDFFQIMNNAQGNSFYYCILKELPPNTILIKSEPIDKINDADIVNLRGLVADTLLKNKGDYFEEVLELFDALIEEDLSKIQMGKELRSFLCSCREARITEAKQLNTELQMEFFDIYCHGIKENNTFSGEVEQKLIANLFNIRLVNYVETSQEKEKMQFSKKGGKTETIIYEETYNRTGSTTIHLLIADDNMCSILKPTRLGQKKYESLFPPTPVRRISIFSPPAATRSPPAADVRPEQAENLHYKI